MEDTGNTLWQSSKLLIKGIIISILALVLLIPSHFVQNLIEERETRQKEAVTEVSSKWAGRQVLSGPVIVLPFWYMVADASKNNVPVKNYAYFLPETLSINSTITPQEKHRGIYKVMLYKSQTSMSGKFNAPNIAALNITEADIIWQEAHVQLFLSDIKGLTEELKVRWNDTTLAFSPGAHISPGNNFVTAPLGVSSIAELQSVNFSSTVNLNGSEQLLFAPVGKTTTVDLHSTWSHPSFTGDILPQSTVVNDTGFQASWTSLAHNRSYPQQWKESMGKLDGPDGLKPVTYSAFGTDLFIPVNGYQKTMRSVKYAILCILLTFTAFFLIETTNKKSVHPLHYALIGFALILFYTLLLSFSEYTGFNTAYIIATVATVGLIAWFVKGLLGSGRLSILLSFVLVLMYSYVFTILQLQDYALLMGSIGLFLTLAVVMYFSRKVQW
jgi:inner membrane protein